MNLRLLLFPFSIIYGGVTGFRNLLFNRGILKQVKFNVPVIVIGNLTTGGTGKTPHVEYIASVLKKNRRVAILSRGYGRKTKGLVIAGKGVTAAEIGDEPMQYYSKLSDVTVCVSEDRVKGIKRLLELPDASSVIVMDDGLQHRHVNPGLKILLTSYQQPFTDDYLLPSGNLRELPGNYKRADCIIVTKCPDAITDAEKKKMEKKINPRKGQTLFFSHNVYDALIPVFSADSLPLEKLPGMNIILFTGIARPKHLLTFFHEKAASVTPVFFADHHSYTEKDMQRLEKKTLSFSRDKVLLVTTEKDYQRLKGTPELNHLNQLPLYYIPVSVKIDKEEQFNKLIEDYVAKN
jgi:tetraacyldisaccharide 4'-kinase